LIEGAAHTCYFEKPDEFNKLLTAFLARPFGVNQLRVETL